MKTNEQQWSEIYEDVKPMPKGTKRFIDSTIGMMAYHENLNTSRLVRVEFYSTEGKDNAILVPVSGNSLEPIRCIKQVEISMEEFANREYDYYDDTKEFFWAIRKLGFLVIEQIEY